MTGKSLDTEIESLVDLDSPVPCGHSEHNTSPRYHLGDAAWMVTMGCTECMDHRRYPVCDLFVQYGQAGGFILGCTCGASGSFEEWCWKLEQL